MSPTESHRTKTKLARIAWLSEREPNKVFTNLMHHFNETSLKNFLEGIQKDIMQLPNVKFELQLLNDYCSNELFDKVVSFLCLNWIQDKEKILTKIFQALKPGKKGLSAIICRPWARLV